MNFKTCCTCKIEKSLDQFKNRTDKPHLKMSYCSSCYNKKRYERRLKNDINYKVKQKSKDLKRRYDLSLADYKQMIKDQDSRCAICGKTSNKTLHVDHNHTTGKVRKLLCSSCNLMIGHAKENPYILQAAMNYLFTH